ncbi:unnamed protein product [Porites evermanni]|uniref:Uncharacterized protein n=1 Tax=Porites evermanni TaxID=104178 RepID=A0ABN8RY73_9CNID|nr:unnamed protein product [Porites evermanni]
MGPKNPSTEPKINSDHDVLDWVEHCHIEFMDNAPPIHSFRGRFYLSCFLRLKKNGIDYRMILNLKELNKFVAYQHFKMDSLKCVTSLMTQGCYMASVDTRDAYYTVPVALENQKYLKFTWRDKFIIQYLILAVITPHTKEGVDTSIYKPHSVRSAATSKAKVNNASLQDIMKTEGWSSAATFARLCDKEINSGSSFATSVLSCK